MCKLGPEVVSLAVRSCWLKKLRHSANTGSETTIRMSKMDMLRGTAANMPSGNSLGSPPSPEKGDRVIPLSTSRFSVRV